MAALRSTDNFIPSGNDARVLFEPGADNIANKVVAFLPSSIQQVEEKQYHLFVKPVRVYVCASRESFRKYYGVDIHAGVTLKLFLSPRIFENGDDIAKQYLTHELSHLHLQQQLGVYKMSRLPMWLKEGLATINEPGFRKFLVSVERGERFPVALQAAYNMKLEELWTEFLHEIDKMG
ncbi:MAG: hypothetical protein PHN75_12395 [Syntrophales bacterium]|nr:hypothetical protein [Syntrophales bacterium]